MHGPGHGVLCFKTISHEPTDRGWRSAVSKRIRSAHEDGIGVLLNFVRGFLRRQYIVIIFSAVLSLAACVIYLRITPPTYTARVQILLGNPKAQFVQQQSLLAEPAFDFAQIETQLQILKSRATAVPVINQLKLADDPDFNGSGLSLSSLSQRVRAWVSPPPKDQHSDAPGQPAEDVIEAFLDRLSATRVGISSIIEISFNSSNANRAAEITNAIANAYIADQLNAKFEANSRATSWLQERLSNLGDQALEAERAVSAFKSQNNVVSSGGKPIDEQQVSDLNSRLVAARTQTSDALAKLNGYEAILRGNSGSSTPIGTLADGLGSPIINNLRQQYLEFERREREFLRRLGPGHLAVIDLRNRLHELRTSILDEVTRYAETSRNELETAKQRQQEIEKQLAEAVSQSRSTNSAELTIRELESRAKELRRLVRDLPAALHGRGAAGNISDLRDTGDLPRGAPAEQEQAKDRTRHGAGHNRRPCVGHCVRFAQGGHGPRLPHLRAN